MKPKVLHCVDDPNMGGVNFALQSLCGSTLQHDFEFDIKYVDFSKLVSLNSTADIICLHGASNWRNLFNIFIFTLRHPKAKFVLQEHHYSASFVRSQIQSPKRFYWMLKLNYWLVDRVIAIAPSQQLWMLNHDLVPKNKINLLGQGRDLSGFIPKLNDLNNAALDAERSNVNKTSADIKVPVIAAYGRFHYQKGFDLLIKAMSLINQPCLLKIAGEGPLGDELEQLAGGAANVEFVGKVERVPEFLNQVDAVVIPSRWEPFGLIFIESLAMNKTIISSQVDGLGDQVSQHAACDVNQGENLPVIHPISEPVSAESIADAINQFLSQTASIHPPVPNIGYINHWKQQQWFELQQAWKNLFKQLLEDKRH
ncbi:glycosyltransferase family 4 protein [Shewanella sp. WPAGA9]|uniref:glycosyltransferase family 4 protein n=1 Tax=Shewanella sp. ENK2 TaxID=2775245 RepID=UPI0017831632|nr:glycosyltransferase family 4 protein [Shewanella sp. WPAGA9]